MTQPLTASVCSRERGRLTVELDDGQRMAVPDEACEGSPAVGERVRILLTTGAGANTTARQIINELLGSAGEHEAHEQR
jgi:outer membrane lipoprotein SlyB